MWEIKEQIWFKMTYFERYLTIKCSSKCEKSRNKFGQNNWLQEMSHDWIFSKSWEIWENSCVNLFLQTTFSRVILFLRVISFLETTFPCVILFCRLLFHVSSFFCRLLFQESSFFGNPFFTCHLFFEDYFLSSHPFWVISFFKCHPFL